MVTSGDLLEDCQLQVLYEGARKPTWSDRLWALSLRLRSALDRRLARRRAGVEAPAHALKTAAAGFDEGEIVAVRPWSEIRATLDDRGGTHGLQFLPGMRRYCGRRSRVVKQVRSMYDERRGRIVRPRDTYLLESVVCSGREMFDREGCGRCCYFFWRGAWLRKTSQPSTPLPEAEGELVRVKSLAAIEKQLDADRRTDGLQFMVGMERFCNRRLRVMKDARLVFDEREWIMFAIDDAVVLENAVCDGRGLDGRQVCDRSCHFVWKRAWLEG